MFTVVMLIIIILLSVNKKKLSAKYKEDRQGHTRMVNAFPRKMYNYHFVSECFDIIDAIMVDMDIQIFKVLYSPAHSLSAFSTPSCEKQSTWVPFQGP